MMRTTETVSSGTVESGLGGQPDTLLEPDRRLVAQNPPRLRDVGPRVLDVPGPEGQELLLDALAERRADRVGELVDGRAPARCDVQDRSVGSVGVPGEQVRLDDVR